MRSPETILTKFSDPAASATSWGETEAALEKAELFWISTVRTDGRPHVTPVVAVWVDEAIWFATEKAEQKVANMRANPQVVMTTGCNEWDGGLDVVVEGEAVQETEDDALGRVTGAFAARWDGRWKWDARDGAFQAADGDGEAIVFRVTPARVWAHSKGDSFGETRHQF